MRLITKTIGRLSILTLGVFVVMMLATRSDVAQTSRDVGDRSTSSVQAAQMIATQSSRSASDIKPPPATLEANASTQQSGIATYCWQEGNAGVCADTAGVATAQKPLLVTSPVSVNLRLPLPTVPSVIQWDVQRVTDADVLDSSAQDQRWWNVFSTASSRNLPLLREQTIEMQVEPGLHVIRVFVAWDKIGDVTYGFLIEAQ